MSRLAKKWAPPWSILVILTLGPLESSKKPQKIGIHPLCITRELGLCLTWSRCAGSGWVLGYAWCRFLFLWGHSGAKRVDEIEIQGLWKNDTLEGEEALFILLERMLRAFEQGRESDSAESNILSWIVVFLALFSLATQLGLAGESMLLMVEWVVAESTIVQMRFFEKSQNRWVPGVQGPTSIWIAVSSTVKSSTVLMKWWTWLKHFRLQWTDHFVLTRVTRLLSAVC